MTAFAISGLISLTGLLFCAQSGEETLAAPSGLLVELLRHPESALITSRNPHFSWIVNDRARGAVQTSYQIQMASQTNLVEGGAPDVWDSGKVSSARSVGVAFGGKPLASNSTYWWRVRTWNASDAASAYSEAQQFHTGDLDAARAWPSESRWSKLGDGWALENRQAMEYETREAVAFVDKGKGRYFVDFGKAAFGRIELTVSSEDGNSTVEIHAGEKPKSENSVDRDPGGNISYRGFALRVDKGKNNYTLQPEKHKGPIPLPEHLGEVFPFRYVEILNCPCSLTKDDVKQQALIYPFDDTAASFSSSDATLNEIWELCKYTMKATNFLGVFIDGQRERIPYEADAYINQVAYYCTDREYAIARYSHEYLMYHPTWPTEWILQSPLMAWAAYEYTGHSDSLLKYYEDLKAKTLQALEREDGLISTLVVSSNLRKATPQYSLSEDDTRLASSVLASIHFGKDLNDIVDWPKGERDGYVFTPVNTVVNAFHFAALQRLTDIARALDKQDDAKRFQ